MRNFNYTARDKAGAMKRGSLQAADRNQALHQLATQGLVPLSVVEGSPLAAGRQLKLAQIISAVVVIVVIVLAVMFFIQDKPKAKSGTSKIVKTTKVEGRDKMAVKSSLANDKFAKESNSVAHVTQGALIQEQKLPAKTVNTTMVRHQPMTNRVIRFGGNRTNAPTGFSSRIEYAINQLVSTPLGMPPPPLIHIPPGEDVKAAFERSILVYDTDTEATIDKKAAVAQAKLSMKDYVAQGGDPNEFTKFYHKQLLDAHEEHRVSKKVAMDLLRAGDKEGAALYIEEQNKKFAEKGYVPISIPAIFQGDGLKGGMK
jgi:hypothetical protein